MPVILNEQYALFSFYMFHRDRCKSGVGEGSNTRPKETQESFIEVGLFIHSYMSASHSVPLVIFSTHSINILPSILKLQIF